MRAPQPSLWPGRVLFGPRESLPPADRGATLGANDRRAGQQGDAAAVCPVAHARGHGRNLETVAPHWHESVARYKKNGGTEKLKKYDYTSYDEDTPYYTMIIREDGHKIKLLLDLNEELLHAMKTQYPEKVYFA